MPWRNDDDRRVSRMRTGGGRTGTRPASALAARFMATVIDHVSSAPSLTPCGCRGALYRRTVTAGKQLPIITTAGLMVKENIEKLRKMFGNDFGNGAQLLPVWPNAGVELCALANIYVTMQKCVKRRALLSRN